MARTQTKTAARDVHQEITDKIIAQLEQGTRPWVKPWSGTGLSLPRRANGTPYRGINVFLLWIEADAKGYRSTTWMTFKQAQELGGMVRKGEKGAFVCYASKFTKVEKDDAGRETVRSIPFLKGYTVFNSEQVDGLPEGFQATAGGEAGGEAGSLSDDDRIAAADAFYGSLGMTVRHGGDRACYVPSVDEVRMPPFSSFTNAERYYDTLGHEATHWTGAKARLARDQNGTFGSADYAREELVAEMGAAYLAAYLGLSAEPREDHAAYIANWLVALKRDKRFILSAASAAQKAVDYMQGLAGAAPALQEAEEPALAA